MRRFYLFNMIQSSSSVSILLISLSICLPGILEMAQILSEWLINGTNIGLVSAQISEYFGLMSQNVLIFLYKFCTFMNKNIALVGLLEVP